MLLLSALTPLVVAGAAGAHEAHVPIARAVDVAEPCPGDPLSPQRVVTGELDSALQGGYVLIPFDVPAGTTAVRVKYCYDQPETPASPERHTLDLGLYGPRADPGTPWGVEEFRGWGGSSHPDVTVSPEGFSTEAEYEADPDVRVPGKTTRAFRPGPIGAGEWAVELGLASIVPPTRGDLDGKVAYRVEIELSADPAFADEPYRPAPYDAAPASRRAGWYAGDFHFHGEHSALGDAPLREVFDYAFRPLGEDGAGLDFITLSDYVSGSSWDEIGRQQARHPGKLVVRSAEVITYRGHVNSHANTSVIDYRHGPLYERRGDGVLVQRRAARPASDSLARIRAVGGFTQISHPTIFPSPPFPPGLCRGCPWEYSDAETDYAKVDAIEIATGPAGLQAPAEPGPNPFTVTGIAFWEDALERGNKIAAVGSSDSHNAGRTPNPVTQAPIGTATTMVFADELSEAGIKRGVQAGHTYVKVTGNDAPDLRLEATAPGSQDPPAIMGDTVRSGSAQFTARVLGASPGPEPYELIVLKDGRPLSAAPVTGDDFSLPF
nr:CehA/McbA family metallohydrolase [Solirubrobacterales bacterium]